jgi:hypothetical protein
LSSSRRTVLPITDYLRVSSRKMTAGDEPLPALPLREARTRNAERPKPNRLGTPSHPVTVLCMLGFRFVKFAPTNYVLEYVRGEVRRQGAGLAFFYFAPTTTLVQIPVGSTDRHLSLLKPRPTFRKLLFRERSLTRSRTRNGSRRCWIFRWIGQPDDMPQKTQGAWSNGYSMLCRSS